jgi:hypothetical protein
MPGIYGCEESLRALRFRCDLGVKKFSQRAQRLNSGPNDSSYKQKKPKPVFFFNQWKGNGVCYNFQARPLLISYNSLIK